MIEEFYVSQPVTTAPASKTYWMPCRLCGTTCIGHELLPSVPTRFSFVFDGWRCPVCGRGNAPFVASCPCTGTYSGG